MYPQTCPSCKTSLRHEPVPDEFQKWLGTHTSRATLANGKWTCPECGFSWEESPRQQLKHG